jgi:hypothetical protein
MSDLDFGPHHKCHTCGKMQPHRRCIEYNDHWFCGITCKLTQERKDNENLRRPPSRVPYRRDDGWQGTGRNEPDP